MNSKYIILFSILVIFLIILFKNFKENFQSTTFRQNPQSRTFGQNPPRRTFEQNPPRRTFEQNPEQLKLQINDVKSKQNLLLFPENKCGSESCNSYSEQVSKIQDHIYYIVDNIISDTNLYNYLRNIYNINKLTQNSKGFALVEKFIITCIDNNTEQSVEISTEQSVENYVNYLHNFDLYNFLNDTFDEETKFKIIECATHCLASTHGILIGSNDLFTVIPNVITSILVNHPEFTGIVSLQKSNTNIDNNIHNIIDRIRKGLNERGEKIVKIRKIILSNE
jgi:hypothetical protein